MKPIPISDAKRIAVDNDYDQVVIVARKVGGAEHVTTYGVDKANCEVAARMGDFFKHKLMGWPGREYEATIEALRHMIGYAENTPGLTRDDEEAIFLARQIAYPTVGRGGDAK